MRYAFLLGAMILCSACGHTSGFQSEEYQYKRAEYLETVFLPATAACDRAGGFMIFEDPRRGNVRNDGLTYNEMRLAVARGCAGI